MKSKNLILYFLLLAFQLSFSQAYHTIDIDGVNSQWTVTESFTNISHDGNSDPRNAYFTWDEDFIYVGISDVEADYDDIATFFYLDVDPTGNNGNTNAYAWDDCINTPFNADYVIVLKNGLNNPDDYIELRHYNGSSWEQLFSVVGLTLMDGENTIVDFNVGADYREFKINRTYVGNPEAIKTCMFTEQRWGEPYWRYLVWPSNDWTDAGRTFGQSIPHYYGFILNDNIQPTDLPYYDCNITGFTSVTKSTSWNDAGNWSDGIPGTNSMVFIPSSETVVIDTDAECYDMSTNATSVTTVSYDNSLSIGNNLYNNAGASGFDVESTVDGNGALIVYSDVSGDITAQCYMTDAQWHTFSASVNGLYSDDLYLDANPEVWLIEYDEATKNYTFISAFDEPLTTMKGWMTWIETSTDQTFHFEGPIHTGTIGADNNLERSAAGDYGYNFVGNPFPAGIDWDASSGWTKTNLNNAIYIFNDGHWSTYINGAATNQGSRYIAMNQGFFVQVADGMGSYPEYGTLIMDNQVCVTDDVSYLKNSNPTENTNLIRLQLSMYDYYDEAVIRFNENATEYFDGDFDAHKMFSYSDNKPLIWSTVNDGMSINTLPFEVSEIPIDVSGINNINMTINATDIQDVDIVYLKDNLTGTITDLSQTDYTFKYDEDITDRFILMATITDIEDDNISKSDLIAYSSGKDIIIKTQSVESCNISIYNLSGIKVFESSDNSSPIIYTCNTSGYYIVKLRNDNYVQTKKVIVK